MPKFLGLFVLLSLIIFGCTKEKTADPEIYKESNFLSHATTFNLTETPEGWKYQRISEDKKVLSEFKLAPKPYQKIVLLTSAAVGFIEALDGLEYVEAVFNAGWIYSPKLHSLLEEGLIKDAGNPGSASLETVLSLQPDLIIAFTDPHQAKLLEQVKKAGVPVLYMDEYQEKTPLGKAEYIRLFGHLLNEKAKADSIFLKVKTEYDQLKETAGKSVPKPTVFADIMRGDIWYMPGGKSFSAQIIADAGGDYLWKENNASGSVSLNFEQVFEKAEKADYWINTADLTSLKTLRESYKNHAWFSAFEKGNVYSLARRLNDTGANDYFETGTVRPDLVLRDLVSIFHPDLLPQHQLYFYQKLQ